MSDILFSTTTENYRKRADAFDKINVDFYLKENGIVRNIFIFITCHNRYTLLRNMFSYPLQVANCYNRLNKNITTIRIY